MISNEEKKKKDIQEEIDKQEKADPGTTNSTDPQENMEGPVSSLMHKIEETFDNEKKDKSDKK